MEKKKEILKYSNNNNNNNHLVLIPCPLQGHMSPMLHLAKLLHSKGFMITIILISTTHESSNPSESYPEFLFQSIDGISPESVRASSIGGDIMLYLFLLNEKCKTPFKDYCLLMSKLKPSSGGCFGPVSCIVYDAVMYFLEDVADEVEIPRIVLRTSSASTFLALSLDQLKQKGLVTKEQHLEQPLPEFPILRPKDMPVFNSSDNEASDEALTQIHNGTTTASAIIWNSLHCLEAAMFEKAEDKILAPIFPICPSLYYKQNKSSFRGLYTEDQSCISWLESQPPKSVLYVSTGSLVNVTKNELFEMAWGLANSDQPFLWVVRPGLVNCSNGLELLPKGFTKVTRKRGKVVQWAPQQTVLAHRSVGGFWTHNGWNSTIESVSEGVPMICWPRVGDQRVNARVVSHVWKVGIELEENFGRWEVERAMRRLMVSEEGGEIRKRALELKEKVRVSLAQGGSSSVFLGRLVDFINKILL